MTLHPWPSENSARTTRQPVLWKRGAARGLMIDTPAVPVCFQDLELADDDPEAVAPAALSPVEIAVPALVDFRFRPLHVLPCALTLASSERFLPG